MTRRGQVFTADLLGAVLLLTVGLGLFLHAVAITSLHADPSATMPASLLSAGLLKGKREIPLDATLINKNTPCTAGGNDFCFVLSPHLADETVARDAVHHPTASLSLLLENGKLLGPAHASLTSVKNLGRGRFRDFHDTALGSFALVFSSSDNTDPRTNGRKYTLVQFDLPSFDVPAYCASVQNATQTVNNNCLSLDLTSCKNVQAITRVHACGTDTCLMRVFTCLGNPTFQNPVLP